MKTYKFATGSNMPGYMPDSEPFHATWAECKASLIADIEQAINDSDMLQVLSKAKALKRGHQFGCTVANRHYWLCRV